MGSRLLFSDASLSVVPGAKIGLVGRNGAGKSTLLSILAGATEPEAGAVTLGDAVSVGWLPQEPEFDPEKSILDNVVPPARSADDWNAPDRARQMLGHLGLHDVDRTPEGMSGGELKRAALARTLLQEPDVLLLDEPTNHLDLEAVEWLEDYLSRRKAALVMVTHDRYFLDRVCNRIVEIDREQLFAYEGNYNYYLRRRAERMEALTADLARVRNLLRTEAEWMRRQPQARGGKAKYRIDRFHELEQKSKVDLRERDVDLGVKSVYIGSKIFEARDLSKAFGAKKLLADWSYTFARGEKVGIVGGNGVGKTTFLRILMGELEPDSGSIEVGTTVKWGYYSQQGMTDFDPSKKVIDAVREVAEEVRIDDKTRLSASAFLSRFLFSPADQQKYIATLSGGERRRLYLATVLMKSPNFLVLDEPTNDLDIMTLSILEDYLAEFAGCVIVVSHDRYFLDRIADHLFVFEGDGKVRDFPGDYSAYRAAKKEEERELERLEQLAKPAMERVRTERKPRLSFKERKELEELTVDLEKLEAERKELEKALSEGTLRGEELQEASVRIGVLVDEIDEKELRALELMEKSES